MSGSGAVLASGEARTRRRWWWRRSGSTLTREKSPRSLHPTHARANSGRRWGASTTPTAIATWSAPARPSNRTDAPDAATALRLGLCADDVEVRIDGQQIGRIRGEDRPAAFTRQQHHVSIDRIPSARYPQQHADDLSLRAVEPDHLDLRQQPSHRGLPASPSAPDLRYHSTRRDERHVCANETSK